MCKELSKRSTEKGGRRGHTYIDSCGNSSPKQIYILRALLLMKCMDTCPAVGSSGLAPPLVMVVHTDFTFSIKLPLSLSRSHLAHSLLLQNGEKIKGRQVPGWLLIHANPQHSYRFVQSRSKKTVNGTY